ncbi:MAG: type VII secretion protein EssC [Lachnospiraceae bacterium]|nr:type VII secretion protein EssC [Lachnospiraceae bacterium]
MYNIKIETARETERENLNQIYYSATKEYEMVKAFSSALFDRQPEDPDYLHICLGIGELPAKQKVTCHMPNKLELEDSMEAIPQKMEEAYENIENVPIVCDAQACNAIGIIGEETKRYIIFKRILFDLCIRHFFKDVNIYLFLRDDQEEIAEKVRLFPHLNQGNGCRNIACDTESRNRLYDILYKRFSEKKEEKLMFPSDIVFMYHETGLMEHPLCSYIQNASDVGVCFFFFADTKELLPQGCDKIIEMQEEKGTLLDSKDKESCTIFYYEEISDDALKEVSEFLSPVYAKEISVENAIPKKVTMFEMLQIENEKQWDLKKNWENNRVYESMAVPVGEGRKDKKVYLDIHEKAHGPHGLVAGTTGSGKSELLQSYILSMALQYSPSEVGFVLIDFKGGGMANQFAHLPHLVGAITNIDEYSMERSLKSIQAELKKRQELLAALGVNHIDDYIQKRERDKELQILPHLIIIVDEFAELKAQQPEFMKELISASRIGRSLGVHLILATQKPSGQVSEQIWSNSRFKLCLKVQSKSDSNEVLKSPLAANIKETGRCYLQVGNHEIFELFQSAYSGEQVKESGAEREGDYSVAEVSLTGERSIIYGNHKKTTSKGEVSTQLEVVVSYIKEYVEKNNIACAGKICMPELDANVSFQEKSIKTETKEMHAEVGILDIPERQVQIPLQLHVGQCNTMVIGSAQSGKTNLLLSVVRSLTTRYTPKEVNLYMIDFASRILKNFEELPHVGGVVCANEEEKLRNLFKLMFRIMEERKIRMESVNVGSFTAYKEAGYEDLPQIVLLIDNLTALKELYFNEDDTLLRLSREGLTVGISIFVCNPQTNGIGYKYLSNFSQRLAFYCNDTSEYANLFGASKLCLPQIPGRCLVEVERNILEAQIYLPFTGEREIERGEQMLQYVKEKKQDMTQRAVPIPVIPKEITHSYITNTFHCKEELNRYIYGLDYEEVEPISLLLNQGDVYSLVGGEQLLHHEFIRNLCKHLERNADGNKVELHILDGDLQMLEDLKQYKFCREYAYGQENICQAITALEGELRQRYENYSRDRAYLEQASLKIIIFGDKKVAEYIVSDKECCKKYLDMVKQYIGMKNSFFWTGIENQNISFNSGEIYRNMKERAQFLVFENVNHIKITDISITTVKKFKKKLERKEGYWITQDGVKKVKLM